jgi:hypothetical protein
MGFQIGREEGREVFLTLSEGYGWSREIEAPAAPIVPREENSRGREHLFENPPTGKSLTEREVTSGVHGAARPGGKFITTTLRY